MSVITETDVANRACQKCGAPRIDAGLLRTEDSKQAAEIRACYDMLRRAELRRNVWRFSIRSVALRAIDDDSKIVTFGAFDVLETYAVNDVVTASDGQLYSSTRPANIGNDPTTSTTQWTLYFGNLLAQEYVMTWDAGITYAEGDHSVGSDALVYVSLADANLNNDPISSPSSWELVTDTADDKTEADNTDYLAGELVYVGDQVYLSLRNANDGDPGDSTWLVMTTPATVDPLNFIYPIGAGPRSQNSTKNAYRLPNGFLREAPQDPKAGSTLFLGAPSGLAYKDWNFEGDYFTTQDSGLIAFRFAADISDPTKFDPLFTEGFACRIGMEVCEPITQSTEKLSSISSQYKVFMTEARTVNGIETGATQPPEDDYIACRM